MTGLVAQEDRWRWVSRRLFLLCAYVLVALSMSAVPVFAYQESATSTDPAGTASHSCPSCHGLESGVTSPTVAERTVPAGWTWDSEAGTNVGTRKGPHGGYTTGTQKCQVCHSIHDASAYSDVLLPEQTVAATCFTCHDGTGGGGVYGVVVQRTGTDPAETSATAMAGTAGGVHRIGFLNGNGKVNVPGGANDGSSLETTFSGLDGSMTCSDCHSVHNSNTVTPFVGDRKRSEDDSTTTIATNRLLRAAPTSADGPVTVYGSNWCASCHKGSHKSGAPGTNHSVEMTDSVANYSSVRVLSGMDTSVSTGFGALGRSNYGYIMTDTNGSTVGGHGTDKPICQQCHEDARNVGGNFGANDQFHISTSNSQTFTAPLDGETAGNPRFQNFPHESTKDGLLIETTDGLCANCHYMQP